MNRRTAHLQGEVLQYVNYSEYATMTGEIALLCYPKLRIHDLVIAQWFAQFVLETIARQDHNGATHT